MAARLRRRPSDRRTHSRTALVLAAVGLALCALTGCENLWSWTNDDESFEGLVTNGREALRDEDYGRAQELFARAVEMRPESSDARFYLAKSAVLATGFEVVDLVKTLTDADSPEGGAVEVFQFEVSRANSVYGANAVVLDNLLPIRDGAANEGAFVNADVDFDLAVAYTLRGIFRLRDTNGDGVIDAQDLDLSVYGLTSDGDNFSLDGLDDLPPEDVNEMLDDLGELLEEGGDSLEQALAGSGVDIEDLDDVIDSLQNDYALYYVNTGLPGNPGEGDNDGDGVADEECLNGIDDDVDGRIDEDSRVLGCP